MAHASPPWHIDFQVFIGKDAHYIYIIAYFTWISSHGYRKGQTFFRVDEVFSCAWIWKSFKP